MASKGQIEKALEAKVVATGRPLEENPYQRIKMSGAEVFTGRHGRSTNAARIRVQAKVKEARSGYMSSSGVEAAELEVFNIDGEIMLKSLYGALHFFGRHDAILSDERYGRHRLGRTDDSGVLEAKAEKIAKELQRVLDEAGLGVVPPDEAVTLREVEEDYRQIKRAYSSAASARSTLKERTLRHVDPNATIRDLNNAASIMAEMLRFFDEERVRLAKKLGL